MPGGFTFFDCLPMPANPSIFRIICFIFTKTLVYQLWFARTHGASWPPDFSRVNASGVVFLIIVLGVLQIIYIGLFAPVLYLAFRLKRWFMLLIYPAILVLEYCLLVYLNSQDFSRVETYGIAGGCISVVFFVLFFYRYFRVRQIVNENRI